MSATVTAAPAGLFSRLWAGYLQQLKDRPLRTKMITSGTMFAFGDSIAQFGIEGRRLGADHVEGFAHGAIDVDENTVLPYNPFRALRQAFYGAFIFAPLSHKWLGTVDQLPLPFKSKWSTIAAKVALDQLLWSPFIVSLFWTSTGIMEGKKPEETNELVRFAFPGAYAKCVMVFGPTQLVNFTVVPLQHRLLVHQTVGLGWNIFLSYMTNKNNQLLAQARADLARAQKEEEAVEPIHDASHDDERARAHAKVENAERALAKARKERHRLLHSEGGGATGAGTRM